MLQKILPLSVFSVVDGRLNEELLYEIRLRSGQPIVVCYGGKYYFLTQKGISEESGDAIVLTQDEIEYVIVRATEYSLYSMNNYLIGGYITVNGGIRIGVCGECVYNEKKIVTIKSFTSLNIRLPHAVNGCGDIARSFIMQDGFVHNALIVAPPGRGKTTILRDLCKTLSSEKILNVLLIDERSEIASIYNGRAYYDVGLTTDVIFNTDKKYAFEYAVRSMRPDIIITDELISEEDCSSIIQATSSGVSVVASIHAGSVAELKTKPALKKLIESKLISRYIFLANSETPGRYESIYDENFNLLKKYVNGSFV